MYYAKHKEMYDELLKEERTDQPSHSVYVNDEEPNANPDIIKDEYVLYDDAEPEANPNSIEDEYVL